MPDQGGPDGRQGAGLGFAAVDLGAESGRVVLGCVQAGSVSLEEVHRFPNQPVTLPDGVRWNLLSLFAQTLEGIARAALRGPLHGVGVDSWGVDYALLDGDNRVLGLPFHYRDARTAGMVAQAYARVSREELYSRTGIQTMPINTVFQLMADLGTPAAQAAEKIALVPDLLGLWLTGELANEATAASTTGLLDARTGNWARDIVARLGLPQAPFSGDVMEPGTELGPMLPNDADGCAAGGTRVPVWTVAGHDTASAFAAAPIRSANAAVLSSGTWSLLGLEVPEPFLGADAAAFNLTNERGLDGTIRLLRNVMGLWLLQECRRCWAAEGLQWDYDELHRRAAASRRDVALFDPDSEQLLRSGDMPGRIVAACRASGQRPPENPGEFVRSILVSLACKYRLVAERLRRVTGREIDVVHVIGGGVRNGLLCQLTADFLGLPVVAGPAEATALGNVLVQARAAGEISTLAQMRELAVSCTRTTQYDPASQPEAAETYERFLAVTGLTVANLEPAVA